MGSYTLNAENEITEQVIEKQKITVGFSRRVSQSLPDFESAEAQAFVPIEVDADASPEDVEGALRTAFAFAKTAVYEQLGVGHQVDPTTLTVIETVNRHLGVDEVDGQAVQAPRKLAPKAPARKAPAKKAAGSTRRSGPTDEEIAAAWDNLVENPNGWFDNRDDKRNPKAPDFKAKRTNKEFADFALWLDSKPEDIEL